MDETRDSYGLLKRPCTPERPRMLVGLHEPLVNIEFIRDLAGLEWTDEYEWMQQHSPFFTQYDNLFLDLALGATYMERNIGYDFRQAKNDTLMLLTFNHWDYVRWFNMETCVEGEEEHQDKIIARMQGLTKKDQRAEFVQSFEKGVEMEVPRMAYCCLAMLLNELEDIYRLLGVL